VEQQPADLVGAALDLAARRLIDRKAELWGA